MLQVYKDQQDRLDLLNKDPQVKEEYKEEVEQEECQVSRVQLEIQVLPSLDV